MCCIDTIKISALLCSIIPSAHLYYAQYAFIIATLTEKVGGSRTT